VVAEKEGGGFPGNRTFGKELQLLSGGNITEGNHQILLKIGESSDCSHCHISLDGKSLRFPTKSGDNGDIAIYSTDLKTEYPM